MCRGDDGNIDGNTITNPYDIANIFNNYLTFVAEAAKQNTKFSHKYFSNYPKNTCRYSFFIQPTGKANIISSNFEKMLEKLMNKRVYNFLT